jgi:amino acid adenylation domain-containing protein
MSTTIENLSLECNTIVSGPVARSSQCFGPRIDQFLKQTFPQLFAEQVKRNPTQVAAVSEAAQLTYGELNAKANQLARVLRNRGVGRESLVGICIDRSLDMAIGILGILKAGAAYLPLDPDYPAERLAWLLSDSKVSLVVTKTGIDTRLSTTKASLVLLDADNAEIAGASSANLDDQAEPNDLAYVIYTSGSTGDPKGVLIEHANLANYLLALQFELQLDHSDRYLHTASISFSSSRRQLLLPLSLGATVVIATAEQRKDPLALFAMIKQREVTVMDAVPSFWRNCTDTLASLDEFTRSTLLDNRLRLMLSASEPLLSDIPQTWMHRFAHPARHVHMFGQTETAGIVCAYRIPEDHNVEVKAIPIGEPIANTEIYILDEHEQPVPPGTPGELYIGGAGVGRGYLNRPDVSALKFIEHSLNGQTRLYRTGDFARLTKDGVIEYAGRQDSQVKVRGFRIELGEIEATLARHPGVKDNAVIGKSDANGIQMLIAYFVARETVPSVSELRTFLNSSLPDYMVPSTFVELAALPLTANGKVDKRALPEPGKVRPTLLTKYEGPASTTEKRIEKIWATVLRIDAIGVNDDFFELGGHSLLAIQVMARINGQFKIIVPLRTLFECSTIKRLAEQVDALAEKGSGHSAIIQRVNREQPLALSFPQQRLWFIDQLDTGSSLYNINKALRLFGRLDATRLNRAVQSIAARHEILRTTFVEHDGQPVQLIVPASDIPFHVADLTSVSTTTREAELDRLIQIETEKPFDLSRGPLLRFTLFRLADDEHVLLLAIHHIISDAWALKIFFQELAKFYEAEDKSVELPHLAIQYADFAEWQRRNTQGAPLAEHLTYWKTQLQGAPFSLNLPSDFAAPDQPSFAGGQQSIVLPSQLYQALRDTCRQEGVTLFMLLLGAFQILLGAYSGLDDILVGTPVAGRDLIETEPLIGCFINTLVLRGNLSGNPTFREVLNRTREVAIDAYTHQSVPFEKLVEELRPERSLSRSPLFQTMFVLENESASDLTLKGIEVENLRVTTPAAKFDLTLGATEKAGSLELWFSYSTDLFAHQSVTLMLDDFKQTLEAMVADPQRTVAQLPALRWQPKVPASAGIASAAADGPRQKPEFVAPRTPIEERLANIWSDVLHVERVGMFDNFFDLGGHSLLAAQVISRARMTLSVELPLRRIFETPNVAGLAAAIYEMQTAATADDELAAMLAELSQLSEDEAQRKFAEEF